MEREALAYIEHIDELGGMVRAIELGFPQKEIAEAAYRYQQQLDRGEKVMVGVNKYQVPRSDRRWSCCASPLEVERTAGRARARAQGARATAPRRARRWRAVREAAAERREPDAAARRRGEGDGARVGEISDVFREVFGVYRDPAWL